MDPFGRPRGQSDSVADPFYQRPSHSPSQQRLPPFRSVRPVPSFPLSLSRICLSPILLLTVESQLLSENGSSGPEQVSYHAPNGYSSPAAPSPRYSTSSSNSRQPTTSPMQSRVAPMPSVSQGFDDPHGRYSDHHGYSSVSQHRTADYLHGGSNGTSHYPESESQHAKQHTVGNQQLESYHHSPNLPSIREMPDRRERMTGGPVSSGNEIAAAPHPNDHMGCFHGGPAEVDHGSCGSRRSSLYSQHHRSNGSYPTLEPELGTSAGESSRYGPGIYEAQPRTYPALYGDVDYSPHSSNCSQQANFGLLGDPNDPRSKRRRGNLPKQVTDILRAWFHDHLDHPYPTEEDKQMFIARTGLSISQVSQKIISWKRRSYRTDTDCGLLKISNWFINARRRQLPSLRNQVRSQEHGRSSHSNSRVLSEREHFSSHESSLSPR